MDNRLLSVIALALLAAACAEGVTDPDGGGDFVAVTSGFSHTCAFDVDGLAVCWGDDAAYQLGAGSQQPACGGFQIPCALEPVAVAGGSAWRSLAAGTTFTCGVAAGGEAYCWGRDESGQLGVSGPAHVCTIAPYGLRLDCREQPTPIASGARFAEIAAGDQHACALTDAGLAWCWGPNDDGRLGTGVVAPRSSPTPVAGDLSFAALTLGNRHTCALTPAGELFCWGSNAEGQLGAPAGDAPAPRAVLPELRFAEVAAGSRHTCAITLDGALYCWGSNTAGQIGDGSVGPQPALPTVVAVEGTAVGIGVGGEHSCAVTTDGAVWCWGGNAFGQLGDGTATTRPLPVRVQLGPRAVAVLPGWRHTCAIDRTGGVWCWGINTLGQLARGFISEGETVPGRVGPS